MARRPGDSPNWGGARAPSPDRTAAAVARSDQVIAAFDDGLSTLTKISHQGTDKSAIEAFRALTDFAVAAFESRARTDGRPDESDSSKLVLQRVEMLALASEKGIPTAQAMAAPEWDRLVE